MYRLWGKIYKDGKLIQNTVAESGEPNALEPCLTELCHELDIEKPVLLQKHQKELAQYGHTAFKAADFIDHISFDKFEIENISKVKK